MKNIVKINVLLFLVLALFSCEEDELRTHYPDSTPKIESVAVNATSGSEVIIFGDSIRVNANISDTKTPLSTLTVSLVINDEVVLRDSMRTKGNEFELSKTYKVPLVAYAEDGMGISVKFRSINVEGNVKEELVENTIKANVPPAFGNRLYIVLADGTVYNLNKRLGAQTGYQSVRFNVSGPAISFKIAEKLTADNQIDYSGFVWGNVNGKLGTCGEDDPYFAYTESLALAFRQIFFDTYSFELDYDIDLLPPALINGQQMDGEIIDGTVYMTMSLNLKNGDEVAFSGEGFDILIANPDFFEITEAGKATFLGVDDTYDLYYDYLTGFLYVNHGEVEQDSQSPDYMWMCGEGMGFPGEPHSTPSAWGWENPQKYFFCRKVSDGVFQVTFYSDKMNMKFFHQPKWDNGEEISTNYALSPATLMKAGEDSSGAANGNFVAGDDFTPGIYKVTLNMNSKTCTIEAVN